MPYFNFCLANKEDAVEISKIHCREIEGGFLSQLGENFLTRMYEAVIEFSQSFVVIAKEDNKVVGFASGCINIREFYKFFFKKYLLASFFILLPKMFNLSTLKKVFELLFYPKKENNLPKAELVSIAVTKNFQGKGVGQEIFKKLVIEMKKRNIRKFKVVVGENLLSAIKFYEKLGFKHSSNIYIHRNELSKIYIYNLL